MLSLAFGSWSMYSHYKQNYFVIVIVDNLRSLTEFPLFLVQCLRLVIRSHQDKQLELLEPFFSRYVLHPLKAKKSLHQGPV
ncbi:hypothetical protein FRX31_022870 [Thalictrum thalictroides]|uniref:Uncharacterized protein n=1 Tax=Thalictrum thalictroides TaxID=46969 RepID=A0A7J6VS10_THATH|nr:hypothetical protein FRX31_022870 [Thalictrum thalictroides]